MQDTENKGVSAKALKNLERNEFFRRFEWGLEEIPALEYSTQAAIFDVERIEPETENEQVDGKNVLKFKFTYIIRDGLAPPWVIGLHKLTVDSKISAKIDAYLSEGTNVLDVQILRTPKGIRYKIEPFEHFQSVPGYSTPLPISWWKHYT
jgi:hypothetical protein